MKLLLIDNYDSFTHNIGEYLYSLFVKNDKCRFNKSSSEVSGELEM